MVSKEGVQVIGVIKPQSLLLRNGSTEIIVYTDGQQ